jgi:hypothetical protein
MNKFLFPLKVFLFERKRFKGEVNIEFVVFTGVMMFILAVASFAALSASEGITADNEVADARRIAFMVASEINLAAEIGDGYVHSFTLPNFLYNSIDYSVAFDELRFVSVHWNSKMYSLPVLAQNVSGTIRPGSNVISNVNGVIYFA